MVKNVEDMYNHLDTTLECDRQTDILPWHSPRYAYASCGKNRSTFAKVINTHQEAYFFLWHSVESKKTFRLKGLCPDPGGRVYSAFPNPQRVGMCCLFPKNSTPELGFSRLQLRPFGPCFPLLAPNFPLNHAGYATNPMVPFLVVILSANK